MTSQISILEQASKSEYFKYIKQIKFKKLNLNQINKSRKVMYIIDNIQPKIIKRGRLNLESISECL